MNNPRAVMGVCVYSGDLHVGGQYRQRNSDMHPHKHLPSASARHAQRLEQSDCQSESHYFVPLEILGAFRVDASAPLLNAAFERKATVRKPRF